MRISKSLLNAVTAVREYYVSRFQQELDEYIQDKKYNVYSEAALRDSEGEIALADGVLPTPSRADFFLFPKRKGDPFRVTIDTENQVDLKPVKTLWQDGSARVTIRSFQWNAAVIKFPFKERAMSDWDPLRKWFMHWFKEDDPEPGELLGAVHFVSDPECIEGVVDILVDFGTAPVESFFELLDALVALGAETLDVGD